MNRGSFAAGAFALIALAAIPATPPDGAPRVLDDFEDPSRWKAAPAAGVTLDLSSAEGQTGRSMRLDFDFRGHAGWAAARRDLPQPLELPENWEISFFLRGAASANDFEVKLVDSSGENVWWSVRRGEAPPAGWTRVRLKKRHFSFAWGPAEGGDIRRVGAIEVAVTAREGGKGWIALDDLTLSALAPPGAALHPPVLSASSSSPGFEAARAMDGDPATAWRSGSPGPAWIAADLGERREYGGLTVRWEPGRAARSYAVETSDDGSSWAPVRTVDAGGGGRADLDLPESESRFVRLVLREPAGASGFGIAEIVLRPLSWSESPNAFLQAVAAEEKRGVYPRSFSGEQTYWTVVGLSGDTDCALLSEDGAVEPSRGSFSVEPFLFVDGRLFSWADVRARQSLDEKDLPLPRVTWEGAPLSLEIAPLASGAAGASVVEVRYRVENRGPETRRARIFLAVRPFQVNPPTQFLNGPGGASPIRSLAFREGDGIVSVDGTPRLFVERGAASVRASAEPARFGAAPFDAGPPPPMLSAGELPPHSAVRDGTGRASGVLAWRLEVPAGGFRDVVIAMPIHAGAPIPEERAAGFERRRAAATMEWRKRLDAVRFSGPPAAEELFRTLRTNLADILIERDGPALRPGTRAYARSWIRDGAMMSAALLRMGQPAAVREYLEWFVRFQDPDGRVPCCVDRRGADAVVENDSHGELIFAIAEYWRFEKDRSFLASMFPHVESAVSWIDRERQRRRTEEFRVPGKLSFFGLLPESISHEGYSAKPVHSYWDDFWALKGLKDAADLAAAMGRDDLRRRWAGIRDEFAADLFASISHVIATRGLDTLPASADLADFDPTSTTAALDPGGELARLPQPALTRTFERYLAEFRLRRTEAKWEDYTPYELRNVGAFVRLGWRDEAQELFAFFLESRRPPEWNGWAESVGRDPRKPRFVGDIPHAWVGSDGIRSILDLFAWERESDGALVLAAGIPAAWLAAGSAPVSISNLATPHGPLTYSMRREAEGLRFRIAAGIEMPRGGLALRPPVVGRRVVATVDGKEVPFDGQELRIRKLPAEVIFREAARD